MSRMIHIVFPVDRMVPEEQIIAWARDDVANGLSAVADRPQDVQTLEDAISVLDDSGTVTVDRRGSDL